MLWICSLTVPWLSLSSRAISLFVRPRATSNRTSRSRGLKTLAHAPGMPLETNIQATQTQRCLEREYTLRQAELLNPYQRSNRVATISFPKVRYSADCFRGTVSFDALCDRHTKVLSSARLVLKIDVSQFLPGAVGHDKAGVQFIDGPGRREADVSSLRLRHGTIKLP
jgi:hypothetical protein